MKSEIKPYSVRYSEILVKGFFIKGKEPVLDPACDTCKRLYIKKDGSEDCRLGMKISATNNNGTGDCSGYSPTTKITGY